jgi:hypothetical protein
MSAGTFCHLNNLRGAIEPLPGDRRIGRTLAVPSNERCQADRVKEKPRWTRAISCPPRPTALSARSADGTSPSDATAPSARDSFRGWTGLCSKAAARREGRRLAAGDDPPFHRRAHQRARVAAQVLSARASGLESGPGRDRTCDLGIKSPAGTTALSCSLLRFAATNGIRCFGHVTHGEVDCWCARERPRLV